MKNQFIARCTFLALLYGTSTSAQPIDFEGAAWVAGPAVLGALCAHEIHQQSVDKIEERLDVVLLFKQVVEKNLIRSQETKVFLDQLKLNEKIRSDTNLLTNIAKELDTVNAEIDNQQKGLSDLNRGIEIGTTYLAIDAPTHSRIYTISGAVIGMEVGLFILTRTTD